MKEEFKPHFDYILFNAIAEGDYVLAFYVSTTGTHQVTRKYELNEWKKYHA